MILVILSLVFKQDFLGVTGGDGSAAAPDATQEAAPVNDPNEEPMVQFVSFVLDDTQAFWQQAFAAEGGQYRDAKLVLFRDETTTACGEGQAATGPFYCPGDQKVYLDLAFFDELRRRFKAPGDFAQAYVIAHELGHHVQNLLGTSDQVHRAQVRVRAGAGQRALGAARAAGRLLRRRLGGLGG